MASSSSSSASSSSASSSHSPTPEPVSKKRRSSAISDSDSSNDSDSSDSEPEQSNEPVLSHAAKRKEKRKLKTKDTEAPEGDKKKSTKAASATQPKRQNSVWVGNLSFKTTAEALRRFFGDAEITRVHMPTKAGDNNSNGPDRKENRGFAYVDFATPEAKVAAIAMSENPLDGRRLLIKDGGDFTGRPAPAANARDAANGGTVPLSGKGMSKTAQKILSAQKQPPAPTLFLGNLGFETTEASIRDLLTAHRQLKPKKEPEVKDEEEKEGKKEKEEKEDVWIRKIRMGTFEDSGLCKGFAFVDFTSIEHATAALVNPQNHYLNGRKLVVEYASADAVRRGGGPGAAGARIKRLHEANRLDPRKRQRVDSEPSNAHSEAQEVAPRKEGREGRDSGSGRPRGGGGKRPRPTPGAALALAKREQAAIVPSLGTKITFDS
ncbi:hypothetical protein HETIRDRAFT_444047 [Heterobasidion irregulare TC 32-1]|uniref:RRM domain-containing protein n=1 Tax=Heterobasidion irregulare (strain TC 32-1) TaxID=747525 RepID=W4KDV4_HETIT|nr:uncharacterized protein HETIRDRAFT_444047 [Heterobasidion irregulare TC 32-1]ETW84032.1 hypothetical protein HETIRDRAFT_444047 [Heterobasidion irregulare TC 32-1]